METMLFALLSFIALIIGCIAIAQKIRILEAVSGLCTSVFALISAYYFRIALIDSGKNPEFLAFDRYPFVLPVYCVFAAAGLVLIIHSLINRQSDKK